MSCPYCNSPVLLNDLAGNPSYKCGTIKPFRSASCVDREPLAAELRNALAHIKRLEEAGDAMKASGYFGGWADAVNKWNKAKEDKP